MTRISECKKSGCVKSAVVPDEPGTGNMVPLGARTSMASAVEIGAAPHLEGSSKCTVMEATFNMVTGIIGGGICMLPQAMAHAGWFPGIGILILLTIASRQSCSAIAMCVNMVEKQGASKSAMTRTVTTVNDVGTAVWGQRMKLILALVTVVDLIFGAADGLLSNAIYIEGTLANSRAWLVSSLPSLDGFLFDAGNPVGRYIFVLCLVLPVCYLRSMKELSKASIVGVCAVGMVMLTMVVAAIFAMVDPGPSLPDLPVTLANDNKDVLKTYNNGVLFGSGIWMGYGLMIFCYGVACMVPCMMKDMEEPEKMGKVLNMSHGIVIGIYGIVAVMSYFAFGSFGNQNTNAIYVKMPILLDIFAWGNLVNFCVSLPLYLNPVGVMIEDAITGRIRVPELPVRLVTRSTIIVLATMVVYVFNGFEGDPVYEILTVCQDATLTTSVNTFLPNVMMLVLLYRAGKLRTRYGAVCLAVLSIACGFTASGLTLETVISNAMKP